MKQPLKPGEKYLTVKMVGHEKVSLFPNKDKKPGSNDPDYVGNGVVGWVNTKQEKPTVETI